MSATESPAAAAAATATATTTTTPYRAWQRRRQNMGRLALSITDSDTTHDPVSVCEPVRHDPPSSSSSSESSASPCGLRRSHTEDTSWASSPKRQDSTPERVKHGGGGEEPSIRNAIEELDLEATTTGGDAASVLCLESVCRELVTRAHHPSVATPQMTLTLVTRTHEQVQQEQMSIEHRYPSITALWHHNQNHIGAQSSETAARLARLDYHNLPCMQLFGLRRLKDWCLNNVLATLFERGPRVSLLRVMAHSTFAAFLSYPGCGVRTFVSWLCKEACINLLIVRQERHDPQMLTNVYREARLNQPCIVLFDRCDNWFDDDSYLLRGIEYVAEMRNTEANTKNIALAQSFDAEMPSLSSSSSLSSAPQLWTIVSQTQSAGVHPVFENTLGGELFRIDPLTTSELEAFITGYVTKIVRDVGAGKPSGGGDTTDDYERALRQRIEAYVGVFDQHDPPMFIDQVFVRALRGQRSQLVNTVAAATLDFAPLAFLPTRQQIAESRTALCSPTLSTRATENRLQQCHPTQAQAAAARSNRPRMY